MNLFCAEDDSDKDDPVFIVSNIDDGMGLLFLLFEKSGYRWSKYYSISCRKEFSLIHVIADRIRVSWAGLVTKPWFSLHNAVFY